MYTEALAEYKIAGTTVTWRDALMGKRKEAIELLRSLEKSNKINQYKLCDIAKIYLFLGEKDHALDWLMKAYEARTLDLWALKVDPGWDLLHEEPQYQTLFRKMNFPTYDENGL